MGKRLWRVREAAQFLGMRESGVRRWILLRRVAVVRLGRLVRIPEEEIERLVKEGLRPAASLRGGRG
jgi:excisionase family DNA binding protein